MRRIASGVHTIEACAHCDGLLRPLAPPAPPRAEELKELIARTFGREGLITALALAVPAWLSSFPFLGWFFSLIYLAALSGYYFQVIGHIGCGRPGLPLPTDADAGDLIRALGRGLACMLVAALPWILWGAISGRRIDFTVAPGVAVLGGVLFACACLPAAIVAVVVANNGWAALWPLFWVRIAVGAPASYARLVGVFAATTAALWIGTLAAAFFFGRIPLFGGLLLSAVTNVLVVLQAVLVGAFIHRHAEQFGLD